MPAPDRVLSPPRCRCSASSPPTTTAKFTSSSTRRPSCARSSRSTTRGSGPALGGCRFIEYDTDEDALDDALRLARGMTYKAALAGLAHGGGKSVIIRPKQHFDRVALFRAFGRFVDDLGGHYITAEDSGTGLEDMEIIRTQTKHVTGVDPSHGGSGDPSPFTALGVRRGIEACVKFKLGKRRPRGHPRRGAGRRPRRLPPVQGAPRRGREALRRRRRHAQERAREARVRRRRSSTSTRSSRSSATCSRRARSAPASTTTTIPHLRATIVAGAANNQLARAAPRRRPPRARHPLRARLRDQRGRPRQRRAGSAWATTRRSRATRR